MAGAEASLDDAVMVIQDAANKLESATSQFEAFKGQQDELISTIKDIAKKVASLEQTSKTKEDKCVPLYERVSSLAR